MNYAELLQAARGQMGPCRACPVCNGRACGGNIPGPGAKGSGTVAIRNFDAWRNVRLNMDTIHENFTPDTSLQLFGRTFKYPFFAGPVGAMTLHYGDKYNDMDYNAILVPACAAAGIAAFTGDGTNPKVMEGATAAIAANGGFGIPTVKPWDNATVAKKMSMARESGCFALAMDIDAAGLPFLQNLTPPAGSKTVEQLQEIAREAGVPFILKGIMTAKGAEKAVQAGVAGVCWTIAQPPRKCCRRLWKPWQAVPKCLWMAASAPAAMCSRRWRWAQTPCWLPAPTLRRCMAAVPRALPA